mgnify:CR=1 FL=1
MSQYDTELSQKIYNSMVHDFEHMTTHHLQSKQSTNYRCTEEEMALACHRFRQLYRDQALIVYGRDYNYAQSLHNPLPFYYQMENISL